MEFYFILVFGGLSTALIPASEQKFGRSIPIYSSWFHTEGGRVIRTNIRTSIPILGIVPGVINININSMYKDQKHINSR